MMVKEEPLEDDPLKTEMLVKIKGDAEEPEMVQPSSAATGTGRRNRYTRSALDLFKNNRLWNLLAPHLFSHFCGADSKQTQN